MSNLHAPTIPSGPTTSARTNGDTKNLSFAELQRKKDDLEAELKALSGVLDSHGVDMNTPLITPDGFPRADIDVAQVRTTRSRIIHLKTDYKELMAVIEKYLHDHFANLQNGNGEDTSLSTYGSTGQSSQAPVMRDFVPEPLSAVFAKVNTVAPDSPAASAGLQPGDELRNFGYVNKENNNGLQRVAECVQGNEGQRILVKIHRAGEELQLNLVPRRDWGGRGLLGCHIVPL